MNVGSLFEYDRNAPLDVRYVRVNGGFRELTYATPFGYHTNLMVYEAGGYRFADYLRLGLPLNLMLWIIASLLIPFIWPL